MHSSKSTEAIQKGEGIVLADAAVQARFGAGSLGRLGILKLVSTKTASCPLSLWNGMEYNHKTGQSLVQVGFLGLSSSPGA